MARRVSFVRKLSGASMRNCGILSFDVLSVVMDVSFVD
jgi:hypothetical protein